MTGLGVAAAAEAEPVERGTFRQRLIARAFAGASRLACILPERPLIWLAELAGRVWYRTSPAGAAVARANLRRVCTWLAAEGLGPERARRAATDPPPWSGWSVRPSAIARGTTSRSPACRPWAPSTSTSGSSWRPPRRSSGSSNPAAAGRLRRRAFRVGRAARRVPRGPQRSRPVAPMETLADPELQRYFVRTRAPSASRS